MGLSRLATVVPIASCMGGEFRSCFTVDDIPILECQNGIEWSTAEVRCNGVPVVTCYSDCCIVKIHYFLSVLLMR